MSDTKPLCVAIVGSQVFSRPALVAQLVVQLKEKPVKLKVGFRRGPEQTAQQTAVNVKLPHTIVSIVPARPRDGERFVVVTNREDELIYGAAQTMDEANLKRDEELLDGADVLVAFEQRVLGEYTSDAHTILHLAEQKQIPVVLVDGDHPMPLEKIVERLERVKAGHHRDHQTGSDDDQAHVSD